MNSISGQCKTAGWEKVIFSATSLGIVVFIALRSAMVGFSNDEAATFLNFVHTNEFFPFFEAHWTANNHYVNSFLTWIAYHIFGVDEWALRLPNLLALPLYFWFVYQIGRYLRYTPLRWGFWLLIFSSYYLLEFFGYCRGYGLSFAFLMGSIFHLAKGMETSSKKSLTHSLLFMALATFSNLSLLVTFMIWLAITQLWIFSQGKWKSMLRFHVYSALPLLLAVVISFILKSRNELYIGQVSIKGTIFTILSGFTGIVDEQSLITLLILIGVLGLVSLIIVIKELIPTHSITNIQHIFTIIFLLNVLAVQLMNWVLDVPFPSGRTALHWYPLFVGMLVFTLDKIPLKSLQVISVLLLPFLIWPQISFATKKANLHVSSDPFWSTEQIPDSFYHKLVEEFKIYDSPPTLYASTSFYTFILAHKNLKFGGNLVPCQDFKVWDPLEYSDYLVLNLAEFPQMVPLYDTIMYDPYSRISLLKRRDLMKKNIAVPSQESNQEATKSRWTELASWKVPDSLIGKPLQIDFDVRVTTSDDPNSRLVTFQIVDSTYTTQYYYQYRIDYVKTDFSEGVRSKANIIVESVPQGASSITVNYWNFSGEEFTLNSSRVEIYQLSEN